MIAAPYFYPKTGGLENYALNIAKGLHNAGYEVFVVTSSEVNNKVTEEKVEGLKVIRLPVKFKFSNTPLNPKWYFQLKRIIKREKPDLINAHTPVPGLADMVIYAAKDVPTVLTCHAASLSKKGFLLHNLVAKLYGVAEKRTLKSATAIITVSDYAKDCLPEKYKDKCTVIHNAINLSEIPRLHIKRKPNRLIFIGSLDKSHAWKGLSQILKTVQLVKKTNSKVEILVVGDGNMRLQYEAEAKLLDIEKNVTFKGFQGGAEKYKLLQSASAAIVYPTTDNDSFPTVFLEAWASKTPIIAAKIGALTSLIQNNKTGLLAQPNNPVALKRSINSALNDTKLARSLTKNGAAKVKADFTWSKSILSTMNQFESLNKKSLLYVANFSINNNSAPSIHVFEVCNNLVKLGINVTLVAPQISDQVDSSFKFMPVKVPKLFFPITYQIRLFFALTKTMIRGKPDYLYVRQESFMLAPALVASIFKIPLVTEVNGLIEEQILSDDRLKFKSIWQKMRVFYYIESRVYKNSQKIIVVTGGLKNNISTKYHIPEKKLVVIENGVNIKKLKPSDTNKTDKRLTVGYVGSLVPWQGIGYMIQAIKIVADTIPNIQLVIVGEGPEGAKLTSLANKLGVSRNITFLGLVDHSEIPSIINSFDVCIAYYTKDRDGMNSPFKVYEYLACGKPVIVSDVSGLGDTFASIALAAKAENSSDLAKKITALIKDKKRQKDMSEAAIQYIASGHTWNDVSKKLAATLEVVK